jgi:serine O-acetyltransferase
MMQKNISYQHVQVRFGGYKYLMGKLSKLRRRVAALIMLIREDWAVTGRDWTLPAFRALAVHRFGFWVTERQGGTWRSILLWMYRMMYRYIRNHYGIEIPVSAIIGRRLMLVHQHGIVFHWKCEVGDDCVIRHNVTLGAGHPGRSIHDGPKIGNKVEIGVGAVIFAGVTIGDGVTIGPNAVVMSNVPIGAKVFVDPPRVLRGIIGMQGTTKDKVGLDQKPEA